MGSERERFQRLSLPFALIVGLLAVALSPWVNLTDPNWPGDASQVLATLMLAAVLEQRWFRVFEAQSIAVLLIVWLWVLIALWASVTTAASGEGFDPVFGAIVQGAIITLLALISFVAVLTRFDSDQIQ